MGQDLRERAAVFVFVTQQRTSGGRAQAGERSSTIHHLCPFAKKATENTCALQTTCSFFFFRCLALLLKSGAGVGEDIGSSFVQKVSSLTAYVLGINAAGAEQKQGSLPWRSEAVHLCPLSEISHSGSLEVDYLCVFPLNA